MIGFYVLGMLGDKGEAEKEGQFARSPKIRELTQQSITT